MWRPEPFTRSLAVWPLVLAFLTTCVAFLARGFAYPTPELMREMAEIGAALLIAYAVEVAWMAERLRSESDAERRDWLGAVVGIGLCGLLGVLTALLVAEHRAAGHRNYLDSFGLWWSALALGSLGVFVALYPVIVTRWAQPKGESAP